VRFTRPKKVLGLDIGRYAVKAIQMSRSGDTLVIDDVGYAPVDRALANSNPVAAQAEAIREAIARMPAGQSLIVSALPGQTVVIRYPRLKKQAASEMDAAIEREASHNIPYDLAEVFLDWSLLDEEGEGEETNLKVLLVAAKNEVIESRLEIADAAEIQYGVLSVDSLALADAAEGAGLCNPDESVALVNIGATSVSIHFTKNGVSNFIRDINWGARELVQAISKARRCDTEHAEALLFDEDPGNPAVAQAPSPPPLPSDADPATGEHADEQGAVPPPLSAGANPLDPLDEELAELGEPSALEDNVLGDTHDFERETPLEEILALPISRLVTEIRRSFDYYEHQLYEKPVDRILISGGVAHLPLIHQALVEDLGVEYVVVANPAEGAIKVKRRAQQSAFDDHPAQFMVAVGLAARGVAEI